METSLSFSNMRAVRMHTLPDASRFSHDVTAGTTVLFIDTVFRERKEWEGCERLQERVHKKAGAESLGSADL
jgi:hypothetical protein